MQYYRTVYSILDLLSDMGGMTASFSSICVLLISGINYFGSYQFLMGDSFYSRQLRLSSLSATKRIS